MRNADPTGRRAKVVTSGAGDRKRISVSSLWARRWPVDLVVVIAVFAYNLPIQFAYVPPGLWPGMGVIVSLSLCVPYLFRRQYPLWVFGIVLLSAVVQLILGIGILAADVMLTFTVYAVAVRFRWPISVPAAGSVVLWVTLAITPRLAEYDLSPGDFAVLVLVIVIAWTWGTTARIRRAYLDGLRERARQLEREKEAQSRIVAAAERARIAREIHDLVSHSLSVVVLMAEGASLKVRSEPQRAESAMLTVRDTARSASAEMRRMLDVLRDGEPGPDAPQPGVARLGDLMAESRAAGLPVALTVVGQEREMSAGQNLAVYRVVQESLTNARKHGGPQLSRVEVELRYRDQEIEVRITDDGRGNVAPDTITGGHGLIGMRERVSIYGGALRAGSASGGGFEIVATVPIGDGE